MAADQLRGARTPTVQHDDLHGGNVFTDRGRLRVIDWGDAVWAHPFGTLLVTRRSLAARWQVEPDSPLLHRVGQAYLEPWRTGGESAAALAAEVEAVLRTAPLTRAAGWLRAVGTPAAAEQLGYADVPAHWLMRLADGLADAARVTP